MKALFHFLVTVLILSAVFAWGVMAHRHQIFPYVQLRTAAQRLGAMEREAAEPATIRSRSPALGVLDALPYADGTIDPDRQATGVVLHDPLKASFGYNLYVSSTRRAAYLLDMDGNAIHQWSYGEDVTHDIAHAEALPSGDLVLSEWGRQVFRIDKESKLLWSHRAPTHHDFSLAGNGDAYLLTRRLQLVPEIHPSIETSVDSITVLSPEGDLKTEVSILDMLLKSAYAFLLPTISHLEPASFSAGARQRGLSVLHVNHIEILDGSLVAKSRLFQKGNILLSMRNINSISIIDWQTREIVWLWGPTNLTSQHHPRLLGNGNILIFDNGIERSRVIELDPLTARIIWQYAPPAGFFTKDRGSNQRLPNGNTLITESDKGYAFEVTAGGEIVWRFANPEINSDGHRKYIWRIERFRPAALPFLAQAR